MVLIHSKRTVLPGGITEAWVMAEDGIITGITNTAPNAAGYTLHEAGNHILMPGVIDPHVHINEPGRTAWEGFDTATKAALAGGITTLVDMPLNASPVTTTVKAFDEKLKACETNLHTNAGFWGGLIPGNEDEIIPLIEKGVLGFKAFLTHSGIDGFPNITNETLQKAMPILTEHGLPLLVHCELTDAESHSSGNERSYKNYLASRPKKWEDNAVEMMINLCRAFNCKTHIVHLSSANSLNAIRNAKEEGMPLTVETAQHYLYFNSSAPADGQTQFKCAPPIREQENNELLWQALKDGIIDFVATDHSPSTPDLKELESGNFMKAWGGIASLQFALPILWTAAKKRNASIKDITKWLCENPAKLIGKGSTKGRIAMGYDADLIVLDDMENFVVTEDIIHHRHKVTPYMNEQLCGVVKQTFIGGKVAFDNGIFTTLHAGKKILYR